MSYPTENKLVEELELREKAEEKLEERLGRLAEAAANAQSALELAADGLYNADWESGLAGDAAAAASFRLREVLDSCGWDA